MKPFSYDDKSGSCSSSGICSGSGAGSSASSSLMTMRERAGKMPGAFRLVQEGKWRKLRKILKDKKKGPEVCRQRDSSGLWLLGAALGFGAKLDVIGLIISVDPSQLHMVDHWGANALHLACLNGSSIDVIRFILEVNGSIVNQRDYDLRMPLHHAVECLCRNEIDCKEGLDVVQAMCTLDPTLIHCQDKLGDTPVDIVHIALDAIKIQEERELRRLQYIYVRVRQLSMEVYKAKKQAWEEIGYDTSYFPTNDNDYKAPEKKIRTDGTLPTATMDSEYSNITA